MGYKIILFLLLTIQLVFSENHESKGDSLKQEGLLMPAVMAYASALQKQPTADLFYKVASVTALMWTSVMRDTSFYFLNIALHNDSTLKVLYDPDFLSLINDPRWKEIEERQFEKYQRKNGPVKNQLFARALFRMIIKDQGLIYVGNIERKKYLKNGGYFSTPAIFPVLALEEKNHKENEDKLIQLLNKFGWPNTSDVTEKAADGAALIIQHASFPLRQKYFPLLEAAFKKGEARPLYYAKMKDRLLVEKGEKQLYGTQTKIEHGLNVLYPIREPEKVDKRRKKIGLGPLKEYLWKKFHIKWNVKQVL